MRIESSLRHDYWNYGRAVFIVVDGEEEFRIVRLHPESSLYIEDNDDAYIYH